MSFAFALLAGLSLVLLLWQWVEALLFPVGRRVARADFTPAVSILKPLKGADAETEACLRSWLEQAYTGPLQVLFAADAADDPACDVVTRLLPQFPHLDAALLLRSDHRGLNGKVAKLAELAARAKHEVLVISDADTWAPCDFVANLVAPLRDSGLQLNSALYQLATPATPAMHGEALAVNADFWSSVLQARRLGPMRFALGAAFALRKQTLAAAGGFGALTDYLADDFELGRRVAGSGGGVGLCPVVVACREAPRGWREVWRHQLRWARTIRHCQPGPYAASLVSNATLWALLWLAASPGLASLAGAVVVVVARLAMAAHTQRRLTGSWRHLPWVWLAPVKDLLGVALWAAAFLGREVEWRGERLCVARGGRLAPPG